MTCQGRSSSSAVFVSCSMTGFSTDAPNELCIGDSVYGSVMPSPTRVAPFMKLSVTQSKWRSRQRRADPFLHAFHLRRSGRSFVVETAEMKETVHKVEPQLVGNGRPVLARVALRGLDADHDVAVLKCEHVRRLRFVHELLVDLGNASVGHQRDGDFRQPFQHTRFSLA